MSNWIEITPVEGRLRLINLDNVCSVDKHDVHIVRDMGQSDSYQLNINYGHEKLINEYKTKTERDTAYNHIKSKMT
jgi:hypothetical protein